MSKITLKSGAVLDITPLPFEEAWGIVQDILTEIKTLGIDIRGLDIKTLLTKEHTTLIGPVCSLLSSKVIREAVKKCWPRATYNGLKIDSSTFEAKDARGDYLFVSYHLLKEVASPFFENLISILTK
jgi:hypothetical protein